MQWGPEAVVNFLFTDVESSSVLWEHNGEAMGRALELHDHLVRATVEAHEGQVVKHLGDGMYVVFRSAPDAVECAVVLMATLQDEPFGELDAPLRVRMGVHTGTATERDGDFFGRAVNRAARVSDTANGDQIVVSEATRELCTTGHFEDHGTHELKGVGVERLYLLRDDRFTTDPRPLRVSKQSNLPTDTSAFVGRSEDLSNISDRLTGGEGLTLVGPGGVGKTRLALRVAHHIQHRYPDGTWFCELDSLTAGESVAPAVAAALGATPTPNRSAADSIGLHLERRSALIILDNCEHVRDEARELVDAIASRANGCTVLATSREPLGRPGERLHHVSPLEATTDGVELMLSRIRERDPEYAFSDRDRRTAIDICRRLDGLPLAIELAVARLTLLPLSEIGALLADRFRLLSDRSTEGRHSTLLQTIRWSYDLLTPGEQRLFAELSVFRGGFTLESVATVTGAADLYEALDLVAGLVDKSMVQARSSLGSERLTLLESLREFGAQQLDEAGLTEETMARHGQWFGQIADDQANMLFGLDEAKAWPVLEQEWDNIRAAFYGSLGVGNLNAAAKILESIHYFAVLAMRFEGLNWAHSWLEHPDAEQHPRLAAVQAVASSASYYSMDLKASLAMADACMEGGAQFDAMPFVAIWAFLATGEVEAAHNFVKRWAEAEARTRTGPFHRSMVAAAAAVLYGTMLRDEPKTYHWLEFLDAECDRSGSPSAIAYAAMVRGMAMARIDTSAALVALRKAEDTSRSLRDRHAFIDGAQTATAQIMAVESDPTASVERCVDALESALDHRFLPRIAHDLQSSAIALSRLDEASTAAQLLGAAMSMGYRRWEWAHNIVKEGLERPEFDRLLEAGHALGPFEAVELALGRLRGS